MKTKATGSRSHKYVSVENKWQSGQEAEREYIYSGHLNSKHFNNHFVRFTITCRLNNQPVRHKTDNGTRRSGGIF
jgi:hypothetical protein